ncbi:unnamed protein product [Larinioides sclopetarius]|uniref:Uncharacterized protein n=1 Tax=Larinioides sclopetarius TaxID=280406 RepID=A0AAV1YW29_9ARAC
MADNGLLIASYLCALFYHSFMVVFLLGNLFKVMFGFTLNRIPVYALRVLLFLLVILYLTNKAKKPGVAVISMDSS